jgi:hypothetical protein
MMAVTLMIRAGFLNCRVKHDVFDTVFFLRVAVAIIMGAFYGLFGAQGLLIFLS